MEQEQRLVIRTRLEQGARDLARRVKELAPLLRCAGCGGRDFALIEEPDKHYRSYFEREDVSGGSPVFTVKHHVASLICVRCGHVTQFSDGVTLERATPDAWGTDTDDEGGR